MEDILERADFELNKLKKASLSMKSRYWRPERKTVFEDTSFGINSRQMDNLTRGFYDQFNIAFDDFCNKEINTKGQKVNRKKLKDDMTKKFRFGKIS